MLAANTYPAEYVDACEAGVAARLETYAAVAKSADASAVAAFAPHFFAALTLLLDHAFVHRTRAIEGKDGNPLNEVRMLCTSILHSGGRLQADKTIKYKPESSVLKLAVGDAIMLDEARFRSLAAAYFAELRKRFT